MEYYGESKEEETYYLAPSRTRPGRKSIIREPPAPPMEDDFDAYTIQTSRSNLHRPIRVSSYQRRLGLGRDSYAVPLDEFGELTEDHHGSVPKATNRDRQSSSATVTDTKAARRMRKMHSTDTYLAEHDVNADPVSYSSSSYSNRRAAAPVTTVQDIKPPSASPVRRTISSGSSSLAKPSTMMTNSAKGHRSTGSKRDREGPSSTSRLRAGSGARAQTQPGYELVERHVLEDGPDRTVTLWREEVAQHGDSSFHANSLAPPSPHPPSPRIQQPLSPRQRSTEEFSPRPGQLVVPDDEGTRVSIYYQGWGGEIEDVRRRPHGGSQQLLSSQQTSSKKAIEEANARDLRREKRMANAEDKGSLKASSTSQESGRLITPNVSRAQQEELKELLAGTSPSSLHLLPTLNSLGIMTKAHLEAIVRMRGEGSPDGWMSSDGYKEVRADALAAGVTVVEWAILLDSTDGGS